MKYICRDCMESDSYSGTKICRLEVDIEPYKCPLDWRDAPNWELEDMGFKDMVGGYENMESMKIWNLRT